MVVPEGFVLPPWYLLIPLLVVLGGVLALLWTLEPPVTDRTVIAFAPWMMFGSTLHVLHRLEAYPDSIAVLFASPSVYLLTATVAGLVWIVGLFLHAADIRTRDDAQHFTTGVDDRCAANAFAGHQVVNFANGHFGVGGDD